MVSSGREIFSSDSVVSVVSNLSSLLTVSSTSSSDGGVSTRFVSATVSSLLEGGVFLIGACGPCSSSGSAVVSLAAFQRAVLNRRLDNRDND